MNKRHVLAVAMSASLLAAALPGAALAQAEEPFAAEDTQWVLSSYSDGEGMVELPEGVRVTLLLTAGQANGSAGCNTYFGSYEITEDTLTFGEFGLTQRLCPEPVQGVEDAYLPLLADVAGWAIDDTLLTLSDETGAETLVFGGAVVEVTAADVAALTAELQGLQTQIDEARAEVEVLTEAAASVNVKKITNRIGTNEDDIDTLQAKTKGLNVENIKKRLGAAEGDITKLQNQLVKTRQRVTELERVVKDHEARIAALEDLVPVPEPS